jgi:hypothetical protein
MVYRRAFHPTVIEGVSSIGPARAHLWQSLLESREAQSIRDLARRLKLDTSFVARTIRLAALAPDIIEAIFHGQEPDRLSLRLLRRDVPLLWEEQNKQIGLGQDPGGGAATRSRKPGRLPARSRAAVAFS